MSTQATLELLRAYESRNVTYQDPQGDWPIVWERARGNHVWDAEGRRYLDLTAAFGVTAAGHANPRVVRAGQRQMSRLLHAMGDVHPHALKAQLARELSALTFARWTSKTRRVGKARVRNAPRLTGKVIFGNSGFEAVEAAIKTARLATEKPGIIAFEGAYHGLGYGALNATERAHFRHPFRDQLREFGTFAPWPACETWACACRSKSSCERLGTLEQELRKILQTGTIGAIIAEPIQTRGGIRIPSPDFLPLLRRLATEFGALLILDEIYTGFGRTGRWFACEHVQVVPDLICLGKALTGGFPLSACVGRADVMDAWPPSDGEAIHTSTFLGHPVGCAMALAQIKELRQKKLPERSATLGKILRRQLALFPKRLATLELLPRSLGLMAGIELRHRDGQPATSASLAIVKMLLKRGFIVLPEGEHAEVVSLTPPLTLTVSELRRAVAQLLEVIKHVASGEVGEVLDPPKTEPRIRKGKQQARSTRSETDTPL